MSASGGGDGPESVCCGFQDALKLPWRSEAIKICIFIADAPPHGLGCKAFSLVTVACLTVLSQVMETDSRMDVPKAAIHWPLRVAWLLQGLSSILLHVNPQVLDLRTGPLSHAVQ